MKAKSHPSWVCGLKQRRIGSSKRTTKSHPSWVCGLKLGNHNTNKINQMSHPSWVCGLKLLLILLLCCVIMSHPSWVCGLKQCRVAAQEHLCSHTLRGCVDWNTNTSKRISVKGRSHPSWVCGLKLNKSHISFLDLIVTPFVGVWIETQ